MFTVLIFVLLFWSIFALMLHVSGYNWIGTIA